MKPFRNYLTGLLLFSAVTGALFYLIEPFFTGKFAFPDFWVIQLIMIAATLAFHFGFVRAVKSGGQASVRYFMGATSAKLMIFMMIMIVYGLLNRDSAFGFILHFFILYLFYTVYEITVAYKHFGPSRRNG